jgi:hypothetical protein
VADQINPTELSPALLEPDLALFPQQQMFNGGPDKSGSGRKPRVKDEGDPVVDMLINTETDDTILDH